MLMKNITVLTVLVIIVCTYSVNNSAYCAENPIVENLDNLLQDNKAAAPLPHQYGFSLGTSLGFAYGQAVELVYHDNTYNYKYLSELRWDIKPVFYLGLNLVFERKDIMIAPGFFSSLYFKAGLPADSGVIENRDWLSDEDDRLTHFSSHTNRTNEFFWLDILAGVSIPVQSMFYIKPFISGSWMRFAFTGKDGYGIYPGSERIFDGDVIHYEQNWLLLAAGIGIGSKLHSPFAFDLAFKISPLTYCAARDRHLERDVTFLDYTGFGLYLEHSINMSLIIDTFEISLGLSYTYIGDTRGPSYNDESRKDRFLPGGEAGAALSVFTAQLIFKIEI